MSAKKGEVEIREIIFLTPAPFSVPPSSPKESSLCPGHISASNESLLSMGHLIEGEIKQNTHLHTFTFLTTSCVFDKIGDDPCFQAAIAKQKAAYDENLKKTIPLIPA